MFALVFVFFSCEEAFTTTREIDIPDHEEKLSVFVIAEKNEASIFISHSKRSDDDMPYKDFIANVTLWEDNTEILNWDYDTKLGFDLFIDIDFNGYVKAEKTYELVVDSEEFGTAKSIQKSVAAVEISDIKFIKNGSEHKDKDLLEFKLKDDKNEENYYLLKVLGNKKPPHQGVYQGLFLSPQKGTESQKINFSGLFGQIFSDYGFNGTDKRLFFAFNKAGIKEEFQKLKIEISSITKDNYNFFISRKQFGDSSKNPFSEPVIVTNNIENGYGQFFVFNTKEYIYEFK